MFLRPPFISRSSWMPKYVPDANCVLYLLGQDDAQSATIRDRSGNGNDGTIVGATWTRASRGLWYLDFDGTDDAVTVSDATTITDIFDSGGTIKFWFNPDSGGEGTYGYIINKYTTNKGWFCYVSGESGGTLFLHFSTEWTTQDGRWNTTARALTIGTWQHVVITYDIDAVGNNPSIYINTSSKALTEGKTPIGTRISDTGQDLLIGDNAASDRSTDGSIALLEMADGEWSAVDVAVSYNQERHLFGV